MKKVTISFFLCLLFLSCLYCNLGNKENQFKTLLISKGVKRAFVDPKYFNDEPLAKLINMPVYTDLETSFELTQTTDVQVYSVGELVYQLADGKPEYFFKGDDMELFFGSNTARSKILNAYIFTWADGKPKGGKINFEKNGATFYGLQTYDSINSKYIAEIKFSWDSIGITKPYLGRNLPFDIAIGDNDDEFKQKAKIGWFSNSDNLSSSNPLYGKIILKGKRSSKKSSNRNLIAIKNSPQIDGIIEKSWNNCPSTELKKKVWGETRDMFDLSASIKCCWDKEGLYFLVEVQDANRRVVWPGQFRQTQTFLDYGWIEDSLGRKVWEMCALDSKPAGGTIKNQKIDTVLTLNKGVYALKYTSDESHSYNDWDDDPPEIPFYGVILYKVHK